MPGATSGDLVMDGSGRESLTQITIKILSCRVARLARLSHDVMGLWLKLPRAERLPFAPGQYIEILLQDGRRRSFSLANSPHDEFLQLHIRHYAHGAFSDHVFSEMQEDARLSIRGPLGSFRLNEPSDRPMIFVVGGTGFAPVKSIIEYALAEGSSRPMDLYWGVRSRRDLYMDELARGWANRVPNVRYTPVLSEPLTEDHWEGRMGLVHQVVLDDFADLADHEVYTSGPPGMVKAVRTSFPQRGLAADRIYSDAFEFVAN